jgi:hypothetical protein
MYRKPAYWALILAEFAMASGFWNKIDDIAAQSS